ncbi:MAG: hypothetical protein H6839_01675 [Planctomycetes bacterium]|nr:hypothetical protein [Planctomycetota bacterium]
MADPVEQHYAGFIRQYLDRVQAYIGHVEHAGQKGSISERAVADLLRDFLPKRFSVDLDATLVDLDGKLSRQCDLVVHNQERFPRMFPMRGATVLPVDVCAGVVEVKANANKAALLDAFGHAADIKQLRYNDTEIPIPIESIRSVVDAKEFNHPQLGWIPTTPPVHAIWCWRTDAESIQTVASWIKEGVTSTRDTRSLPDVVVCLDKAIVWHRRFMLSSQVEAGMSVDDLMQTAHFRATVEDETARLVKELPKDAEPTRVSPGLAGLWFLWTLMPKLAYSEAQTQFTPKGYIPPNLFKCDTWPFGGSISIARDEEPRDLDAEGGDQSGE